MSDEPRVVVKTAGLKPADGTFRDTDHPSENYLTCVGLMETPTITKVMAVADKMMLGQTVTDDDMTALYEDGLTGIVDTAIDAINMIGRRDDEIHRLNELNETVSKIALDWKTPPVALHERLRDLNVRIERMIYLPLAYADDEYLGEALESFIEDDWPDDDDNELWTQMPGLLDALGSENVPEFGEFVLAIRRLNLNGFLIQLSRPVTRWSRNEVEKGEDPNYGSTSSWGHAYLRWAYGATLPEALERAAEWAEMTEAKEKTEAKVYPKREAVV
ncbi:hypothetical protein BAJUN_01380 [Bajunvirus bajun]|uniref:Uncharacterized protein n=1 Tax=Brevundimonas phage vB_BgoS-Bajun TaxID=2948594 RepID=A0A9E7N4K1_9CAUD|nr:hypothetical protein BAJUN_01380 [Brevundimonas phage vB_BgoS-Bajun]